MAMGSEAENRESFHIQAGYCAAMDAPITARVSVALAEAVDRSSATGARVVDWTGEPVADALALRLVGGLHALHRAGVDPALSRVFAGEEIATDRVIDTLRRTLAMHDAALVAWLDGPPQTNEAARSAGLMTGLLHVAARFNAAVELIEIGSSAGLNLLMARYAFDLGGVQAGPEDGEVVIRPEWRGTAPPDVPIRIVGARGVDIAPVDVGDPAQAERLAAYVWVDAVERQERLTRAIALVRKDGVALDRGDAADWVEARLAEPQTAGVTRVLIHSVVWQYLPDATQQRIRDAMAAAAACSTVDRPLAWVMMEPNRDLHRHEVRVQAWPGDVPMQLVAHTHAHGAWVEGLTEPFATVPYVMRPYSRE